MKSEPVSRTIRETIATNHGLSQYLDNLNRGRPATPRSWLYEKDDPKSILKRWIAIMQTANNKTPFGSSFNQFDLKQVRKFGPQGKVPPVKSQECLDVILPLYTPSKYDNVQELAHFAPKAVEFGKIVFGNMTKRARPKSFESVVDDMRSRDTLSTNSGFPRFARRRTGIRSEIRNAVLGSAYDFPAILLFRQYNGKLRPVWMTPMSLNLIEFSYAQVVQDSLLQSPLHWVERYLSPWRGFEDVKLSLTATWNPPRNIAGGDTTAMDAHMRRAQIYLVYLIVSQLFQARYKQDLYKSLMHICEIPLLYSKSATFVGAHGLASGSGWTQLAETVLQLFMAWNIGTEGQGIGDDFYWLADMSAEDLVDYLGKFGLPANPAKQSVGTTQFTFLQRLFSERFVSYESGKVLGAYYPTIRALNSMIYPEKFHDPRDWSSDMFCIRNYTILENCIDDPCFSEFVDFVVHGHKDMIPFAKKSAKELCSIQSKARSVPGLSPTYNQEKRDKPLHSFASIQLARKM